MEQFVRIELRKFDCAVIVNFGDMAYLKCALCEKSVAAVKVLPCLHVMCETCVTGYIEGHAKVANIIPCPSCGFKLQLSKSGTINLNTYVCVRSNGSTEENEKSADICDIQREQTKVSKHYGDTENGSNLAYGLGDHKRTMENVLLEPNDSLSINIRTAVAPEEQEINIEAEKDCDKVAQDKPHSKIDYLNELLKEMRLSMSRKEQQIDQLEVLLKQLIVTKEDTERELESRAEYLCGLIHEKKNKLLNEINNICNAQLEKYRDKQEKTQRESDMFNDAHTFSEHVLKSDDDSVIHQLHNDISGRLLDLIHSYKSAVDIFSVKLDLPERGKEELHLSKLFGQFLSGSISCGSAELVSSFDIELSWPSSLITTKLNDFVVVGKTGAFETTGKVLFCESNGHLKGTHTYDDDTVPFDAVSLQDGSILVSDNHGAVTRFSLFGNVQGKWKGKFKGSGKMARTFHNNIVITSSEEQCIYKYNSSGELIERFPPVEETGDNIFQHPHGIAVDSRDNLIIADYQQNCVLWLDATGKPLHRYSGTSDVQLRCPSAVCCDPFDNVLIADFTNDSIHLVSSKGDFLGYLLTKENDVSCPNFLTLHPDGLLFVGQYGGQIQVFRYLSCARQA